MSYSRVKRFGLIAGPLLFVIINNLNIEFISEKADAVISVATWMITWWVTEAVSISNSLITVSFISLAQGNEYE